MLQNERKKTIIIALIFLVIIGTLGTLTFLEYNSYATTDNKITGIEGAKEKGLLPRKAEFQAKIEKIPRLKEEMEKLAAQVEQYAKILPTENEMAQNAFANTMQKFAENSSIEIISADPITKGNDKQKKKKTKQQSFTKHSYHFELKGTFRNFLDFLHKVENWHRFLVVQEIQIRSASEGKSQEAEDVPNPEQNIELVLSTYVYNTKS